MRVLFLALGCTRRSAVVAESAEVVAAGGTAVVVVGTLAGWGRSASFAKGVAVVDLAEPLRRHPPLWAVTLFLYRLPRIAVRLIGRGPLRARARNLLRRYETTIADKLYRRWVMPWHTRLWPTRRTELIEQLVLRGEPFDAIVVTDVESMPDAARLLERHPAAVSFSLDHLPHALAAAGSR